jgi:signal transduction histidine kinase
MNIRYKLLVYNSVSIIFFVGVMLILIYESYYFNREEVFKERVINNINTGISFSKELQEIKPEILHQMSKRSTKGIVEQTTQFYSLEKKRLFSNKINEEIASSDYVLSVLSPSNRYMELEEDSSLVIGIYYTSKKDSIIAISKAFDVSGHKTLKQLQKNLFIFFGAFVVVCVIITFFISRKITKPIQTLTKELKNLDFETSPVITVHGTGDEIAVLSQQFNKLMSRLTKSFAFQKHAINHISHELKTPIAILVSNFERIEKETDFEKVQKLIVEQKESTKNLADIINTLLEIAKTEASHSIFKEIIRIDEEIFDVIDDVTKLEKNFKFDFGFLGKEIYGSGLEVLGNKRLLTIAFTNLALNCIRYSTIQKASITVETKSGRVVVSFSNQGPTIKTGEEQFLFQHFFRGTNSLGKRGFGLGLVLTHRIITLHKGKIIYKTAGNKTNIFEITLPLYYS